MYGYSVLSHLNIGRGLKLHYAEIPVLSLNFTVKSYFHGM